MKLALIQTLQSHPMPHLVLYSFIKDGLNGGKTYPQNFNTSDLLLKPTCTSHPSSAESHDSRQPKSEEEEKQNVPNVWSNTLNVEENN